eukprot:jgi/Ulvmu1/1947/UM012_0108.1
MQKVFNSQNLCETSGIVVKVMPRTLYWASGSPPCWRVMAVLHAKSLPYDSKMRSISKGDFKTEEVLAINPRGQAPTFHDGDVVVNESMAIMQYLEEAYPETPLLPTSVAERATVYQRMHEAMVLQASLTPLFHMGMASQDGGDEKKAEFEKGLEGARKELAFFEGYLAADPPFLVGEKLTLADVCFAVVLFFLQRSGATLQDFPHLLTYATVMAALPLFLESWPPHWKTSDAKTFMAPFL